MAAIGAMDVVQTSITIPAFLRVHFFWACPWATNATVGWQIALQPFCWSNKGCHEPAFLPLELVGFDALKEEPGCTYIHLNYNQ